MLTAWQQRPLGVAPELYEHLITLIPRTKLNRDAGVVIHRGQVEYAAGGGVCAVSGENLHAGATVVNGSGEDPTPGHLSVGTHTLRRWKNNALVECVRDN